MAQKESRRSFLTKMGLLAAGTVFGGTALVRSALKKDRVEQIYDVVKKTSQSGMSLRPCIDQKGQMRTGFGCLVKADDFVRMGVFEAPTRGSNTYPFDGNKRALYDEMTRDNQPGRSQTYSFDAGSIRQLTMNYIRAVEPEIERMVPNYKKLPVKAQGLLVQTYLKTDGRLADYPKMCAAFNRFDFNVSEKDVALKSAINLYDAHFSLAKINAARVSVLKEIQTEQNKIRQNVLASTR